MRKIIALLLLFFVVSSCNTNEVYNKNIKDFPANRWLKNSQHAFVFDIEDENVLYDFQFNLTYGYDYQFESIPLIFKIIHPNNKEEIISTDMFLKENGKEKGDCLGDICDIKHFIREKIKLTKGPYQVVVLNNSQLPYLPNISRIGLVVLKSN